MTTLSSILNSVKCDGAYLEVGCAEGYTTIWQARAMQEAGISRKLFVVDTFAGFTVDDKATEYQRGKRPGLYEDYFVINKRKWFNESMRREGLKVTSFQSDCSAFDYQQLGTIAFAMLDVDLYRPIKLALPLIHSQMAKGGVMVIDDCDASHALWDGAYQAYTEYCKSSAIPVEIIAGKFGIIRT